MDDVTAVANIIGSLGYADLCQVIRIV